MDDYQYETIAAPALDNFPVLPQFEALIRRVPPICRTRLDELTMFVPLAVHEKFRAYQHWRSPKIGYDTRKSLTYMSIPLVVVDEPETISLRYPIKTRREPLDG